MLDLYGNLHSEGADRWICPFSASKFDIKGTSTYGYGHSEQPLIFQSSHSLTGYPAFLLHVKRLDHCRIRCYTTMTSTRLGNVISQNTNMQEYLSQNVCAWLRSSTPCNWVGLGEFSYVKASPQPRQLLLRSASFQDLAHIL